jgi:hypothetical protein
LAGSFASQALTMSQQLWAVGMPVPEVMLSVQRGFLAAGNAAGASEALARGVQWIRSSALPSVPSEFRDSYLHRNPVNRALLTAESRAR